MIAAKPKDFNEYISGFPNDVQLVLEQIRNTIKEIVPEAKETIKYGMPSFFLNGNLVHFAAFKNHIGFYPVPTGNKEFEKEFIGFKTGRGSIQFPIDKPMPLDLISKIVRYNVREKLKKADK